MLKKDERNVIWKTSVAASLASTRLTGFNVAPGFRNPVVWGMLAKAATTLAVVCLLGVQGSAAQETASPVVPATTVSVVPAGTTPDILPEAPHLQTIAQGVVTIDGPVVWRVRELSVSSAGAPESPGSTFVLQRTGATVIRNELTSRRTRLDPGEAEFLPAGDPILRYAVGTIPGLLWDIELLPPEAVAEVAPSTGTVLYTSDATNDYPQGTFEAILARNVLLPGEVAVLPPYTGAVLVLVTAGEVDVSIAGGQGAPLPAGSGRLISGQPVLRNTGTQSAAVVIAALNEPVTGSESPPGVVQETPAPTPVPNSVPEVLPVAPVIIQPTPMLEIVPVVVPTEAPPPPPAAIDTDGDNIADEDELNIYGTDPYAWDTDGDGLGDGEEVFGYGTNPLAWDTDGDGISDGEEVYVYGTNPLDPASGP